MSSLIRHRFKVLLASVIVLLLIVPLLLEGFAGRARGVGPPVLYGVSTWAWLVAALVVSRRRGVLILALGLLLPSVLLELAAFWWPAQAGLWHHVLRIL